MLVGLREQMSSFEIMVRVMMDDDGRWMMMDVELLMSGAQKILRTFCTPSVG